MQLKKIEIDLQLFGGRGSGSVSRAGGGGGVPAGDILDTKDMIVERGAKQAEVDETLGVFRDFKDEYGTVIEEIQVATLGGKSKYEVMGYYDGANIAINETFFNKAKMDTAYAQSVASGWHPSNGNKSGMEAVVAHEIGHKLTADVGVKMGKKGWGDLDSTATAIVNEARKQTKHRGVVQMSSKISRYATSSNAEAIAEAVSDVYCNGKKAKAESRAIVAVVNKYLKS